MAALLQPTAGARGPSADVAAIVEKYRALETENHELKLTIKRLTRLAYVDGLTGLANRRYLQIALDHEIRRAVRCGTALTLLLCDVDRFKLHNDRFGHPFGDAVLLKVGEMLVQNCRRAGDVAARYGGEEFALLLPGIDPSEAIGIAERVRKSVAGIRIRHADLDEPGLVTISIGATTFLSAATCDPAEMIRAADAALYRAKKAGRNQTQYEATNAAVEGLSARASGFSTARTADTG